jgi:hypothetical protein
MSEDVAKASTDDTRDAGKHRFPTEAEMKAGCLVVDRTWAFVKWQECFVGKEVVKWMIANGYATDKADAVHLGQDALEKGDIYYVGKDVKLIGPKPFKNSYLFYRWSGSEYWLDPGLNSKADGTSTAKYQLDPEGIVFQLAGPSFPVYQGAVPVKAFLSSAQHAVVYCVRRLG